MSPEQAHVQDAKRLLDAFERQACIYERLLESCEVSGADPLTLATEAAEAQKEARGIQESVRDVLEKWAEISSYIDPELRVQIDSERHRIQQAMLAVLARHEGLLEQLDPQKPGKTDASAQLRLAADAAYDLS
ncbi:MAG: hypothetical protein HRU16_00265 [Planctomycetes bacterium]|nr:hypothetical protein [Planctomycetota bacterium]